jgi:hypothetical protein
MCLSGCGCGQIRTTKGDKGDTGATGATGATGPQGPAGSFPTPVYILRDATVSSDIYNGGNGYNFQVSGSLPAGTNCVYQMTMQLYATDVTNVNIYPIVDGTPDTTYEYNVTIPAGVGGDAWATITLIGFVPYTAGNVFQFHVEAGSGATSPVLKTVTGWFYTI